MAMGMIHPLPKKAENLVPRYECNTGVQDITGAGMTTPLTVTVCTGFAQEIKVCCYEF